MSRESSTISILAGALNPATFFGISNKKRSRLVAKNGDVNITHKNISKRRRRYLADIFTTLIDLKWRYLMVIFAVGFLGSWLVFAGVWYLFSYIHTEENSVGINTTSCIANVKDFTSVLLFSMETQTTIGYGFRYATDKCIEGVFLVMFQSVLGAMLQALLTGLIFVKVMKAKRQAKTLLFSKYACIFQQDGNLWLTIRVGDMRKSHMIGCVVRAVCVMSKVTSESYYIPCYRHFVKFGMMDGQNRMSLRWPVVIKHKISSESPFWEVSPDGLKLAQFELIVFLEGVMEASSMMVQARTSYIPSEILWGRRFKPMVPTVNESGELNFDYMSFNTTVPSPGTMNHSASEANISTGPDVNGNDDILISNVSNDSFSGGSDVGEPLTWDARTGMRFLIRKKYTDTLKEQLR